jgi:hypothetical protein
MTPKLKEKALDAIGAALKGIQAGLVTVACWS